jgi:hypothetical protein
MPDAHGRATTGIVARCRRDPSAQQLLALSSFTHVNILPGPN